MSLLLFAEIAAGFLLSALFLALYVVVYPATRHTWRLTAYGRHLVAMAAVLLVLLGLLLLSRILGGVGLTVWVLVAGALDVVLLDRVRLLVRAQRRAAREAREGVRENG